ncbi:hypothetical protein MPER_12824 [Moniliophthora perniciosa FA553]|nr:hypothetical protein MPER_12824 [Moniliophthora perniciosa FA553]
MEDMDSGSGTDIPSASNIRDVGGTSSGLDGVSCCTAGVGGTSTCANAGGVGSSVDGDCCSTGVGVPAGIGNGDHGNGDIGIEEVGKKQATAEAVPLVASSPVPPHELSRYAAHAH